jgi:16S rRNA (cytidine1402-2'-O)-methyltransferase
MHNLFLVGTPIGNLEDISLRAIRILGEVDLIAAEDTRHTGRLLKHYDIDTPLVSYHEYSGPDQIQRLLLALEQGSVALVSDAGMPGLSDPGYKLVKAAVEAAVRVTPVPGPSAAITALIGSGLPTDSFLFMGFLPRQRKARRARLAEISTLPYTLIFYEAPHRLMALLADVLAELGDRALCVGRELTKLHEEIWRGTVTGAVAHYERGKVKGEVTLIIAGASAGELRWPEDRVRAAIAGELATNVSLKSAAASIARYSGWSARELYALALDERE